MKVGKSQILLPSGVMTSRDGSYHYWPCSVSGATMFAPPAYWLTLMERYKTEENLVKTYVSRNAKKYLEADFTVEQIKELVKDGKLPKLGGKKKKIEKVKRKRKAGLKTFAVGTTEVVEQTASGSLEVVKTPVYPWQGNPDYFRSPPVPFCLETESKFACMFPNRNLDDLCRGCPVFDKCNCDAKFTEKDWAKGVKRDEVKITRIASFSV